MAEDSNESAAADEGDAFSLEAVIAFQRRLESDPDAVSNEEIMAEYGAAIAPEDLRDLFRRSTFGRSAKNPRASARAKLRRRLVWLSRSLEEVEDAIAAVRSSAGRVNKSKELDEILAAIERFRRDANLPAPEEPREVDPDLFERLFGSGPTT